MRPLGSFSQRAPGSGEATVTPAKVLRFPPQDYIVLVSFLFVVSMALTQFSISRLLDAACGKLARSE